MTTDSRIDELEQQVLTLQRRLVEAEAKSIRAEQQLERVTVEVAVRDAIAKSSVPVHPAAVADIVKRAAAGTWKPNDQQGLLLMDGLVPAMDPTSADYTTPARWLAGLQTQAPHLFQAPGGSDAGAVKNPWLKESFNMTEQGRIYKADPDLAKQLATQAGVRLEG
jgi:hypothetical protein